MNLTLIRKRNLAFDILYHLKRTLNLKDTAVFEDYPISIGKIRFSIIAWLAAKKLLNYKIIPANKALRKTSSGLFDG